MSQDLPICPKCSAHVDIKPAWKTLSIKGTFAKGQGVRCRNCDTVLEFSQWRLVLVRFAPILLLVPFIWYRDSSQALRIVVSILVLGTFLPTFVWPITRLFELKVPEPFSDIRSDDEVFQQ